VSFQRAAATFGIETALAYAALGARRYARFVAVQGALQEVAQPVFGVASVSCLTAKSLGKDNHFAAVGRALPGQRQDPVLQLQGQPRAVQIQTQLHRGGYFVDVLTAGAGAADKPTAQRVVWN